MASSSRRGRRPRYPFAANATVTTGRYAAVDLAYFPPIRLPAGRLARTVLGVGSMVAVVGAAVAVRLALGDRDFNLASFGLLALAGFLIMLAASLCLALVLGRPYWQPRPYASVWLSLLLGAVLAPLAYLGYDNVEDRGSLLFDVFDAALVQSVFITLGGLLGAALALLLHVPLLVLRLFRR
jgi:hypothetical protein